MFDREAFLDRLLPTERGVVVAVMRETDIPYGIIFGDRTVRRDSRSSAIRRKLVRLMLLVHPWYSLARVGRVLGWHHTTVCMHAGTIPRWRRKGIPSVPVERSKMMTVIAMEWEAELNGRTPREYIKAKALGHSPHAIAA